MRNLNYDKKIKFKLMALSNETRKVNEKESIEPPNNLCDSAILPTSIGEGNQEASINNKL